MYQFNRDNRLFFKKLTDIGGQSISSSECRVRSYTIDRDLLKKTTSTFNISAVPNAIENGDTVGMYDSFGTIKYLGVVTYINDSSINTDQIYSIFEDQWLWNNPRKTTVENTLKTIIENDYQNSNDTFMNSIYNAFTINTISSTSQVLQTEEDKYVIDFSSYLYDIYEKYSIQLMFDIPYEASTPTINIGIPTYPKLTIGNNSASVRNFNITTNIYETNKLIVYSDETGAYRETWYGTKNGITDNPSALNRIQKIKTNIVFSDDPINVLKASSLRNQMYNHEITCDLILDNQLLPEEELKLGQEVDLYYNNDYYNTILTGYQIKCDENSDPQMITLKFGLVRTSLTSKLFKKLAK